MHHGGMKKLLSAIVLLALAACAPSGPSEPGPSAASSSSSGPVAAMADITVAAPSANATVASPLTVTGEARGSWYFEASFPVRLLDANGLELAAAPAQAQGDWMTSDFVPFQATLTFAVPATATGTLVLQKDNPSGEPQNDASVTIPVSF